MMPFSGRMRRPARGLGPMEIQDQMDGYALVQAQTVLQLSNEQTPNFVARYMTLQQLRRRYNQERNRMMRELRPLRAERRTQSRRGADRSGSRRSTT